MVSFIVRRLALGLLTILIVATATFTLLHAAPGEPFAHVLEDPRSTPEHRAWLRDHYGLDEPVPTQFVRYMGGVLRSDLGDSYSRQRPVRDLVSEHLPRTLLLMGAALGIGFALGIALGAWQAARRGSSVEKWVERLTVAIGALPDFWVAFALLLLFGSRLHWFPIGGMVDITMHDYMSLAGRVRDVAWHLVLPASSLGLLVLAVVARYQRAALLDVLPEDFIRTARAKGVAPADVIGHHALRNALLPTITLFGLSLPALVGGAVLIEWTYSWPGMGKLAVDAIVSRDYPVVLGVTMIASVMVVVGGVCADLAQLWADPRLRHD